MSVRPWVSQRCARSPCWVGSTRSLLRPETSADGDWREPLFYVFEHVLEFGLLPLVRCSSHHMPRSLPIQAVLVQLGPHRGSLDGNVKVRVDVFHERQRTPGAVPPIDLSSECRDDLWGQSAASAWMDALKERVQTTGVVGVDGVTHAFGTHNLERGDLVWCLALNAVPQG